MSRFYHQRHGLPIAVLLLTQTAPVLIRSYVVGTTFGPAPIRYVSADEFFGATRSDYSRAFLLAAHLST